MSLAEDAVDYATEPAKGGGESNVPSNLTTAELDAIYSCKVTNWNQLPGGGNGKPEIFIPPTSSGTRSFFLSAIGVTAPGTCVNDLPTKAFPGGTLEQDEGVNPAFAKNPQNVIFPYSVGDYLAQRFHSGKCCSTACTAASPARTRARSATGQEPVRLRHPRQHAAQQGQRHHADHAVPARRTSTINPASRPRSSAHLFEVV